jgi:outer membrane protein assembly factor BamB
LTVLSLNSTLYLLQRECSRWLVGSWWGTSAALWLTMMIVTLLGLLWAWRRHITEVATESAPPPATSFTSPLAAPPASLLGIQRDLPARMVLTASRQNTAPGRTELITLTVLTVSCLILTAISRPFTLAALDVWDKMLLMFSAGLVLATLHALYRRWAVSRGREVRLVLAGEGVLLWTMLLVGVGFATTMQTEGNGGISDGESASEEGGWEYRLAWRFRPEVPRSWIASSPVVEGERVYIGVVLPSAFGGSGAVYCVDRRTGKELWVFNADGQMKDVFSSPCVADGRVYIGEGFHQHADCKLYCLDTASGKKLWDFPTKSHTESSPCVVGGKVYFGAGDDGLYCLDAANGNKIWHLPGLHVDANPLVIDNRLYGGSGLGDVYKEVALFCLDAETGKEHWRLPVDLPVWGMPAIAGEYLYAGLGNGNFLESAPQPAGAVLCLERATGRRVWRYDVRDGVHVHVCVDAKNVWFASRDQQCYCLDHRDGTLRWKVDLGSPILASPALVEDGNEASLYVAGSDGLVRRLDAATGKVVWSFDVSKDERLAATVYSSPLVQVRRSKEGEMRWLWFGCGLDDLTRGALYCLEEKMRP